MSRESGKDLTSGSPFGLILGFALPMLLGLLFQQFYNMVDTMVVGQCLGVTSLAAVGSTGSINFMINGFCIGAATGLLFQQFYNMVDTMVVGQCLGVTSLAAVGSTGSINFMINGFCIGAATGFAIPVAQKFGAGDYKGMRKFVANAGYLAAVFAVVMTAAVGVLCMDILRWMNTPEDIIQGDYKGMRKFVANAGYLAAVFAVVMTAAVGVLCMDILRWMNTPEDIIQGAYDYIFVIFMGIPVTYMYNLLAGIIRSLGDSKTPVYFLLTPEDIIQGAYDYIFVIFMGIPVTYMYNLLAGIIRSLGDSKTPVYFLLLSSVLNIGLDFFTILVLRMGVGGPALATVVSQGISAVLCLAYMLGVKHRPGLFHDPGAPYGRRRPGPGHGGLPGDLCRSVPGIHDP